jgi:hypothetical protein
MSNILDSFILRTSCYDSIKNLKDEQLGKLFRTIFEFAKAGEKETELDNFTEMVYSFISNQIKDDTEERENRRKRYREMGQKSGEARRGKNAQMNNTQPSSNQVQTKFEPSSNQVQTQFEPSSNQVQTKFKPSSNTVRTQFKPSSNTVQTEPLTRALEDYININNNNIDFSNEKSVYDSLSRARVREQFDIWWNLYDKKVGKEKTLKKWLSLKDEDRQKCIDVAPRYVEAKPDKRYRKDPLTYLNNAGWNDEIIDDNKNINENSYDRLESRRGSPAPGWTDEEYEQGNTWEACQ